MTTRDPDGPPEDVLAHIFEVPDSFEGEWPEVYDSLVEKMKNEASGIAMGTVQVLLIERIAFTYVDMRVRENSMTVRDRKEYMAFWLSMTAEFNKLLKTSEDARHEAFKMNSITIMMDTLDTIEDKELRKKLVLQLKEQFAALEAA